MGAQATCQVFNCSMLNSFKGDKYVTQKKEHGRTETMQIKHYTSLAKLTAKALLESTQAY